MLCSLPITRILYREWKLHIIFQNDSEMASCRPISSERTWRVNLRRGTVDTTKYMTLSILNLRSFAWRSAVLLTYLVTVASPFLNITTVTLDIKGL